MPKQTSPTKILEFFVDTKFIAAEINNNSQGSLQHGEPPSKQSKAKQSIYIYIYIKYRVAASLNKTRMLGAGANLLKR
jgi:hypothetical protein